MRKPSSDKKISGQSAFREFLRERKPMLDDVRHTVYLWKKTPLALVGTVIICLFLLVALFAADGVLYMMLLPPGHSHEALTAGYYAWVIWGTGVAWNRLVRTRTPLPPAASGETA